MKNLKEIIVLIIDYIEENLYDKIFLDDIFQYVGVLKYYLYRIFKFLIGEFFIEYV